MKLNKTICEDVIVKVSILYDIDVTTKNDKSLLGFVQPIEGFNPISHQAWGVNSTPNGLVVFEGRRSPSEADKDAMVASVDKALSLV